MTSDQVRTDAEDSYSVALLVERMEDAQTIASANQPLPKFGLIEPSTSTVFIGMTLGGTWGFILVMVLVILYCTVWYGICVSGTSMLGIVASCSVDTVACWCWI